MVSPSTRAGHRHRRHARRRQREFLIFFVLSLVAIIAVVFTVVSYQHVSKAFAPTGPGIISEL